MTSLSHIFPSHAPASPPQVNTFSTTTTSSPLPTDASDAPSLLVSILPHRLQFLSIQKPAVPSLCYPLLRLLLEAQDRNSFLSYTETDDKDVSLLLDASLLAEFKASLAHLPGLSITPPAATAGAGSASAIQLIGYPLRAIQVLEGYSGHVETAIIATVSTALAEAGFSIFYVSTNHADYVLVRDLELAAVLDCLADKFVLIKDEMEGDEDDDAPLEHEDERKEVETDSGAVSGRDMREAMKASSAPPSTSLLSPDSAHSDWSDDVRKSPRRDRRRHDTGSESSEDEDRMIREAMRRSKRNKHKRTAEEREGIAEEEESEQDEYSQASRTPPSAFFGSMPLNPSPALALSSLSLAASSSFSSGSALSSASTSARPLRLQAMPYSLVLFSFSQSNMPSYFSALLQLIFFPPRPFVSPTHSRSPSSPSNSSQPPPSTASTPPLPTARFFSFTMIDHDYSLITTPPSTPSASFPATLLQSLHSSQQWSVIEALGVFRYDESGLVSRVSRPLSGAGLRFFYFSSWRTGFVIVHSADEKRALEALKTQFQVLP